MFNKKTLGTSTEIFSHAKFECLMKVTVDSVWSTLVCTVFAGIIYFPSFSYSEQAPNYSFIHQASSAPLISYYDYIIIGGGTAGCPLAATLSQHYNVLLIERGGSPYGNQNITNLTSFGAPLSDDSPTSISQRFISEDGVVNARARVLGGGTCLNARFYSRAEKDFVKNTGLDKNLVKQSYEWVEKIVAFQPTMLQWQSAVRDGLIEVGILPYNGFTYDHIVGTKIGGTIFDRNGHRHTAADLLQYANPEKLTVLLSATVQRILFRTRGKSKPTAHCVIFKDATGLKHKAYLNKGSKSEIILSAGAIGSPQLLMLSGLGPAEHLRSHNIAVVVDQPMVGQGMSDNPMHPIFVPSPSAVELSLIQVVGITRFGSYIEAAGQLSGSNTPDAKVFSSGFLVEKVTGPVSTGHLELRSRNPDENPLVTFNYFKEPEDLRRCVAGLRTIERVIESKAFSKFRYSNLSMQALRNMTLKYVFNLRPKHENTSTSLEQYCKDALLTIWHYHGGCQVDRVVDRDYKVLGVNALRVVDGSTFKYSPGTNPQATVMMLGRYVGTRILNKRLNGTV